MKAADAEQNPGTVFRPLVGVHLWSEGAAGNTAKLRRLEVERLEAILAGTDKQ
jgi:hypothetical protein